MSIKVMLFGSLADLAGKSELWFSNCQDIQSLKDKLLNEFPELRNSKFLISVDKKLVKDNHQLQPGTEVAFLPPFAGG